MAFSLMQTDAACIPGRAAREVPRRLSSHCVQTGEGTQFGKSPFYKEKIFHSSPQRDFKFSKHWKSRSVGSTGSQESSKFEARAESAVQTLFRAVQRSP